MPYDINAALERLEKNLQDLDSARNQVEQAVKASTDLQSVVSEYVSSVKTLCVGLQAWEASLKAQGESLSRDYEAAIARVNSTCTEIINSFGTVVKQTSTDFKDKTGSIVEKFTEQNRILTERVQDLNALKEDIKKATAEIQEIKESLSQISKDLKESQESQDAVLEDIKQKLEAIPTVISTTAEGINEKLSSIQEKADSISSLLSKVNSLGLEIKSVSQQIQSTLQSSTESLISSIESSKNDTAKSININRWITIAAFIILAILHFIIK